MQKTIQDYLQDWKCATHVIKREISNMYADSDKKKSREMDAFLRIHYKDIKSGKNTVFSVDVDKDCTTAVINSNKFDITIDNPDFFSAIINGLERINTGLENFSQSSHTIEIITAQSHKL